MTQYCVLSSQVTSVGYVGNVICLKFVQESFKALFEKDSSDDSLYNHLAFWLILFLIVHRRN